MSNKKINCATHGTAEATFLCGHLTLSGPKQGFVTGYSDEQPDTLYPHAWCNACDAMLEREGDWSETAIAFAKIKMVCSGCYQNLRAHHWLQDEKAYEELARSSLAYLQARQSELIGTYELNKFERWDWYQESATLVFSHAGRARAQVAEGDSAQIRVEADIAFVGSISTQSNSWLWSWANESLLEPAKADSRIIRTLGEEQNFLKLCAAHWSADQVDGWEMTAIMAKALGAIGSYRTPSENGYQYMVVKRARWLY